LIAATEPGARAAAVALVGASAGIGSIAGPAVTSALGGVGLAIPVAAAGVVVALATIATIFGLRARYQSLRLVTEGSSRLVR
jgi:hypothetical protein